MGYTIRSAPLHSFMIDWIRDRISRDERGRRLARLAVFPAHDYRPRWWVRALVNPLVHERRGIIRRGARLDLLPSRGFVCGEGALIEDRALVNNIVGDVRIGPGTLIGVGSTVIGPVEIGRDVLLAQYVVLSGLNHAYDDPTRPISAQGVTTAPILVEDGAWLGAHAVITAGVRIGRNAVVAAGSVVTRDVADFTVVAGSPAREVRRLDPASGRYARSGSRNRTPQPAPTPQP